MTALAISRSKKPTDAQIRKIRETYRKFGNNTEAAAHLGINRTTVAGYTRDIPTGKTTNAPADLTWQDQAACNGYSVEMFFPYGPTDYECINEAKAVCATCPVVAACLTYAADTKSEGVWGGRYLQYSHRRKVGAV